MLAMLRTRKVSSACQSCRLRLLSLFEYGFSNTRTTATTTPAARYTQIHHRTRPFLRDQTFTSIRAISASRRFADGDTTTKNNLDASTTGATGPKEAADVEAVVRQARQTFGETLPAGYLSEEEYVLYERLYGPPLRETRAEDLEYLPDNGLEEVGEGEQVRNVLLRENGHGGFDEVEFDAELGFEHLTNDESVGFSAHLHDGKELDPKPEAEELGDGSTEPQVEVQAQNEREAAAIRRLQQDMDAALARSIEETEEDQELVEEEVVDEEEEENYPVEEDDLEEEERGLWIGSDTVRTHPHTMAGRMGTSPSTILLPEQSLVRPITELLERTNMKHLTDAAEKAFGGKGLPFASGTPASKKIMPQKHIGLDPMQHKMTEVEADAYIAAVMPGTYASVVSTLVEVRKRLGSYWLRDLLSKDSTSGPKVLDAGAGGSGAIAWKEMLDAEWEIMTDDGLVKGGMPEGRSTVITGASTLRHRVSKLLDNTTFLPRLPDYIHASNSEELLHGAPAQGRKSFDIIIAAHTLFPLKEDFRRKNMVDNLWSLLNPDGGVLILIEKGLPLGFEAVAGARSLLLNNHIASPGDATIENDVQEQAAGKPRFVEKEKGMIIAPCTNHTTCPMYTIPGLSSGRKDFCHFSQRFIRPQYLQRVLGASHRSHEDVKYSYIAVRRGIDAREGARPFTQGETATDQAFEGYEEHDLPTDAAANPKALQTSEGSTIRFHPLSLPRAVLPPLKRRGHVTLDLCTPSGALERWTVPRSFSKTAYRDARKSQWGDLWALGAKTRVGRSPRLGRKAEGTPAGAVGKENKGTKKVRKNRFDIIMGKEGVDRIVEAGSGMKFVRGEKRTKGGRVWKPKKPIGEDDL